VEGQNWRCQKNIARRNVPVATLGFSLIRAVIRASAIVQKSAAKRREKPLRKGAGWPKTQVIGVVPKTWKKPNSGA
jgi:hypothetical protein